SEERIGVGEQVAPPVQVRVDLLGQRRERRGRHGAIPVSIQRRKSSTVSSGHMSSHGIEPSSTRSQIASACALTSACERRSKRYSIASTSPSRNSGRMSAAKLG